MEQPIDLYININVYEYKTFIINDEFLIYDLLIHKSKLHTILVDQY